SPLSRVATPQRRSDRAPARRHRPGRSDAIAAARARAPASRPGIAQRRVRVESGRGATARRRVERARLLKRAFLLTTLAALAAGAWLLHAGVVRVPDRYNPWAPLDVDEPPGWLTRFRLARLIREPQLCLDALSRTQVEYTPLPDREIAAGCRYANAVRVEASGLQLAPAFALSCPAAVSLALWERHVLQPAAEARFGQRA